LEEDLVGPRPADVELLLDDGERAVVAGLAKIEGEVTNTG
jgi:hypothetical protein